MAKSVTLYGIPNCDTVKKARNWLDGAKVAYVFHDYRADGLERAKVEEWIDKAGLDVVLNRQSTTFKALSDEEKAGMTRKKAVALMLAQPTAIKRPVLEQGATLLFGFKPDIYADAVKS